MAAVARGVARGGRGTRLPPSLRPPAGGAHRLTRSILLACPAAPSPLARSLPLGRSAGRVPFCPFTHRGGLDRGPRPLGGPGASLPRYPRSLGAPRAPVPPVPRGPRSLVLPPALAGHLPAPHTAAALPFLWSSAPSKRSLVFLETVWCEPSLCYKTASGTC